MDIQDLEAHPGPRLLKCGARSTSSAPSANQLAVRILWPLPQVSWTSITSHDSDTWHTLPTITLSVVNPFPCHPDFATDLVGTIAINKCLFNGKINMSKQITQMIQWTDVFFFLQNWMKMAWLQCVSFRKEVGMNLLYSSPSKKVYYRRNRGAKK